MTHQFTERLLLASMRSEVNRIRNRLDEMMEDFDALLNPESGYISRCERAATVLSEAFGHAEAPYTPAALEALAILNGWPTATEGEPGAIPDAADSARTPDA